jgi:hypothetical protein
LIGICNIAIAKSSIQVYSRVAIGKGSTLVRGNAWCWGSPEASTVYQAIYRGGGVKVKRKEIWLWRACWAVDEAVVATNEENLVFNKRD